MAPMIGKHHAPCKNSASGLAFRCEAAAERIFRNRPRLQELQQIIGTAGFGADSGKLEAAERLAVYQGAGDLAINVQVADEELALDAGDVLRTVRIETP